MGKGEFFLGRRGGDMVLGRSDERCCVRWNDSETAGARESECGVFEPVDDLRGVGGAEKVIGKVKVGVELERRAVFGCAPYSLILRNLAIRSLRAIRVARLRIIDSGG
jgi:hypothetical protein